MITTVKVLGIAARSQTSVAGAARRVVNYVEGASADTSAVAGASYYSDGARASGRARGSGAVLVGLGSPGSRLTSEQLQRLLSGEHAASGRPLLSAVGSASRLSRSHHRLPSPGRAWFTLAEAASIAGVDVSYLRRLARASAQLQPRTPASATVPSSSTDGKSDPATLRFVASGCRRIRRPSRRKAPGSKPSVSR
ncbi:exported hypothetical protein [Frankia sp. AiPs1]|uniref:relaxase domain-containing protein n=1 Tax=Frankia sp. AiPa1 TaxID=573492 RepID=UPI0035A8EF7A